MITEGNHQITYEEWYRYERVDVVFQEGRSEEVKRCEDGIPSKNAVDTVDDEDTNGGLFVLCHTITIQQKHQSDKR